MLSHILYTALVTCHNHRYDVDEGGPYSGADVTTTKTDTTSKTCLGYKRGDQADLLGMNNMRGTSPGDALAVCGLLVSSVLKNRGILS